MQYKAYKASRSKFKRHFGLVRQTKHRRVARALKPACNAITALLEHQKGNSIFFGKSAQINLNEIQ